MILTTWLVALIASIVLLCVYAEDNRINFLWPDGSERVFNPLLFGLPLIAVFFTLCSPF